MAENNYKVRLVPIASLTYGADPATIRASQVAFDVTPSFSETGSVEYEQVSPVHMPGAMQSYKRTNSRTFEIGAHFISRNVADALKNMQYLQRLRAWRMPYFGATDTLSSSNKQARLSSSGTPTDSYSGSNEDRRDANAQKRVQASGVQLRGAPPDVLYLYAYSNSSIDGRTNATNIFSPVNINRVPVVVTNIGITYPEDVDYIPVYDPSRGGPNDATQPFPIKMDVTISLVETHSPSEFERFDLLAYKNGNLGNF